MFMQVSVAVGSQLDFMATYAELAGVPLPNITLDSHSLTPVLFWEEKHTGSGVHYLGVFSNYIVECIYFSGWLIHVT